MQTRSLLPTSFFNDISEYTLQQNELIQFPTLPKGLETALPLLHRAQQHMHGLLGATSCEIQHMHGPQYIPPTFSMSEHVGLGTDGKQPTTDAILPRLRMYQRCRVKL